MKQKQQKRVREREGKIVEGELRGFSQLPHKTLQFIGRAGASVIFQDYTIAEVPSNMLFQLFVKKTKSFYIFTSQPDIYTTTT